ncbi:MAG: TetR/AcrR family transcriptional regulator [Ignavibacteriaceae bacterium]
MTEQLSTEKHNMILNAARKRFAYYGFSKVTMDEISADVGMGKASLYYYFPTKESLFHEVIKNESEQFFTAIQALLEEKISASKMLRGYAAKRMEYFHQLTNLRALTIQQSPEARSPFLEFYKDFHNQEIKILQQILQTGKKTAEFSISNAQQMAEIILQMMYGPRAWLFKMNENKMDEEAYIKLDRTMKEVIEIILNGISKRK